MTASVDTSAEYSIRGWLCIYYTFKHLNRFICNNYPVRTCYKFSLRPSPVLSVRWRLGEMGPEKVIVQGYKKYSNNSDHFPREIIIIARCIQQIVTCYNIFSSHKHFKVGQVFTSAVSVTFRKFVRSRCHITRSISVSHRCVVRRAVCNDADITWIKLLTTGAVSH